MTDADDWRQLPTEVLRSCLDATVAAGLDEVRFPTADWFPSALRVIPVSVVEAELSARARCD